MSQRLKNFRGLQNYKEVIDTLPEGFSTFLFSACKSFTTAIFRLRYQMAVPTSILIAMNLPHRRQTSLLLLFVSSLFLLPHFSVAVAELPNEQETPEPPMTPEIMAQW